MRVDRRRDRRIGVIVPGFSADAQDWCIPALRTLIRELARDNEVEVFPLRYPFHHDSYEIDDAVVHSLGGGLTSGIARIGLLVRARARIASAHRERRFDLLHAFWADEPGFLAVTSARALGIPAVVSVMGGELAQLPQIGYGGQLGGLNRRLTRYALRHATEVTVGSDYLRRTCDSLRIGRTPLRLPLGVDTALFTPPTGPEAMSHRNADFKLLTVASLIPVKDHATLLRAVALAGATDLHLHLVGEGPLRATLESLAADLGIAASVTFHGHVRHEDLPPYYRAADLYVQSSLHESQSLVVLEAAACGVATAGTAVGVLPELEPAGRAVPVGNPRALANALLSIMRTRETALAMGMLASEIVRRSYSLERTVGELKSLYSRMAPR